MTTARTPSSYRLTGGQFEARIKRMRVYGEYETSLQATCRNCGPIERVRLRTPGRIVFCLTCGVRARKGWQKTTKP